MGKYRTAQGKTLDMSALAAKNEKVRAVGNVPVNARGDTIDSFGNIIKPMTEKVNEMYSKTVGNKSAHARKPNSSGPVRTVKPEPKIDLSQLNELEKEIESNLEEDLEIEQLKAKELKK